MNQMGIWQKEYQHEQTKNMAKGRRSSSISNDSCNAGSRMK
jgi:hypothetical protein